MEVPPSSSQTPLLEAPESNSAAENPELTAQQRKAALIIIGVALVLLIAIVASFIFLMNAKPSTVAQLRDVFIIFMALQSLLIGLVLVILMIQVARLTNLLQNEIKPILEATNQTVSNLRGTSAFLSDNLVEPVIKANEYAAGLAKLFVVLGITRQRKKP